MEQSDYGKQIESAVSALGFNNVSEISADLVKTFDLWEARTVAERPPVLQLLALGKAITANARHFRNDDTFIVPVFGANGVQDHSLGKTQIAFAFAAAFGIKAEIYDLVSSPSVAGELVLLVHHSETEARWWDFGVPPNFESSVAEIPISGFVVSEHFNFHGRYQRSGNYFVPKDPSIWMDHTDPADRANPQKQRPGLMPRYRYLASVEPRQTAVFRQLARIGRLPVQEAKELATMALEQPTFFRPRLFGAILMSSLDADPEDLSQASRRVISLNRFSGHAYYFLGQACMKQESWLEAAVAFMNSVRFTPIPQAYIDLGTVCLKAASRGSTIDFEKIRAIILTGAALFPDNENIYKKLREVDAKLRALRKR